jgi:hypothetical protein
MKAGELPSRAITPPLRCAEPLPSGFQLEDDDLESSERGSHWSSQLRPMIAVLQSERSLANH